MPTTKQKAVGDSVFIEGRGYVNRDKLLASWEKLTDGEREMLSEAFRMGSSKPQLDDWTTPAHLEPSEDQGGTDDAFGIQVGGSHYRECAIQPGQYILANGIGFFEGCMIKRLTRYNRSTGKGLEDLRKVRHEIDILIQHVERHGIDIKPPAGS